MPEVPPKTLAIPGDGSEAESNAAAASSPQEQLWQQFGHQLPLLEFNHLALLNTVAQETLTSLVCNQDTSAEVLGKPAHETYVDMLLQMIRIDTQSQDLTAAELLLADVYQTVLKSFRNWHVQRGSRLARQNGHMQAGQHFPLKSEFRLSNDYPLVTLLWGLADCFNESELTCHEPLRQKALVLSAGLRDISAGLCRSYPLPGDATNLLHLDLLWNNRRNLTNLRHRAERGIQGQR